MKQKENNTINEADEYWSVFLHVKSGQNMFLTLNVYNIVSPLSTA